jgi:hypothetical protein
MKTALTISVVGAATALALLASPAAAQEANTKSKTESAPPPIAYKAPQRGAPATRVGGGTRSVDMKVAGLSVLAPNETGYTTREKPTIYWFVSETLTSPVELTITSTASLQDAATPALEITLQPPIAKGLHALALEAHGVVLKPGVEYQWFVAVVSNAAQRSNDVIAGGSIKRIAQSEAVQTRLKETAPANRPALYAGEGLWYDAIEDLSKLISADPGNRRLREQRAALLEQVGLGDAAAYDRAAGR